jgi:hypothetical protein
MRVPRLIRTPEGISPFRACIRDVFDASREDGISNQNLCGDRYLVLIPSYLLMPDGHVPADYSLLSVLQLSDHPLQYHLVTPPEEYLMDQRARARLWIGSRLQISSKSGLRLVQFSS